MTIPALAFNSHSPAGIPIHKEDLEKVKLFRPFKQKSVEAHNHLGVSPMCMYSAIDGHFNDYHVLHYGSLALKGPGLIIIEASGVTAEGRITPQCAGIWKDSQIEGLKRVVDVIKSQGSVPGIQIAHAGRKASTSPPFKGDYLVSEEDGGWPTRVVGPTEEPFASHYPKPHALTVAEIKEIIQSFADAAVRADKAGIEVLEIHGAHGYLISSFYSASSNKRIDEYGGSFENRIRFVCEVVEAVRKVWPEHKPLWIRLSCTDYTNPEPFGENPNGWDIYQTIKLAKELKKLGVDTIDCSSGGIMQRVKYPPIGNPYQAKFAEVIRKEVEIYTAAVGLIVDGNVAEDVLEKGQADFVLVGREFLRNSAFVLSAAQDLDIQISWPQQYSWAVKKARRRDTEKSDSLKTKL